MKLSHFALLAATIVGCGGTLTAAGRTVRLMKADPPAPCKEVGTVEGRAIGPSRVEHCKNVMRNKAAAMGANYVRFETIDTQEGYATGTAYSCPDSPGK